MYWQNSIYASILVGNVLVPSALDCIIPKEHTHELHDYQITYEQLIETPKHLKIEALRELSEMTKDLTESYFEIKERHDKPIEMIEQTKPPLYSDRPPPELNSQTKYLENSYAKEHEFTRPEYNYIKTKNMPVMNEKNNVREFQRTITYSERVSQVKTPNDEIRRQDRQLRREQERAERRNRTRIIERGI